jgi:hypothetical protein
MSLGHEMLARRCFEAGATAIYLCPDTLIPDGCVAEAQSLVEDGAIVVLCTAIRFEMDGIEEELQRRGLIQPGKPITISKREAVAIGLRNLHSESRAGEWDAPYFGELNPAHGRNHFPTCCFWRVPSQDGIYITTHNWAPFVINYRGIAHHNAEALRNWAIDGDYIYLNFGDRQVGKEIRVIEDSDSIILIGLTPRGEMMVEPRRYWWQSLPVVDEWSKGFILNQAVFDRYTDPLRRSIYSIGVRWHARDLTPEWKPIEWRARNIMAEYMVHEIRPLKVFTSFRPVKEFVRAPCLYLKLRLLWLSYAFTFHAPLLMPKVSSFLSHLRPVRMASYVGVLVRAICGDRDALLRIWRRIKIIAAVLTGWRFVAPFVSHLRPVQIAVYARVIRRAMGGDPIESARIRRRIRIIVAALSGRPRPIDPQLVSTLRPQSENNDTV